MSIGWSAVAGVGWGAVAIGLAWCRRPPGGRVHDLMKQTSSSRVGQPGSTRARATPLVVALVHHLERIGRATRWVAGRRADRALDRRAGAALLALVVTATYSAVVAAILGALVWLTPLFIARHARRARNDRVLDELPDAIDLLRLALGAGNSLRLAIEAVAPRAGCTISPALRSVEHQLRQGAPLAAALDGLQALGEPFRPVLDALVLAEREGAPILPLLDRLAADARRARRQRAEEVARRVPVKLLFPLVFCTLPAFGLLTVVPLLASALDRFTL